MAKSVPLPCPFCGRTPYVSPNDLDHQGARWAFVQCMYEHCDAKPRIESHSAARGTARGYQQVAILLWNRRPSPLPEGV